MSAKGLKDERDCQKKGKNPSSSGLGHKHRPAAYSFIYKLAQILECA
jgi:hypothetical protein